MAEKSALSIRSLSGGYLDNNVLHGISLEIEKGSFTAIAGPNGSGKSTFLKYLIRELPCPGKTVFLDCNDINELRQREIARLISFMGQYVPHREEFTVREAVALGRFSYGDVQTNTADVDRAMSLAGISELSDKLVTRISGGEFQLAMLARTICQDAPVLALDEPVNNLDPRHQIMLLDLLSSLSSSGKTILCVLHDLNAIMRTCPRCILLKDGRVFAHGETKSVLTPENIKSVYGIDVTLLSHEGKSVVVFD